MQRKYLADLREKRNESQQDVADALGISRQYYCMIESGDRQKRMDVILITSLANHFGISATEIVAFEQSLYNSTEKTSLGLDVQDSA